MKRWQKGLLITFIVIIVLVLLVVGGAWLYVNHLLNKINYSTAEDYTLSPEEVEQLEATNPDYTPVEDEEIADLPVLEELEQNIQKDPGFSAQPMPDASVERER